jgi:bacteriorhodopsin
MLYFNALKYNILKYISITMNTSLVISSFYITYIFLLTTSVITFIEALRSPIPQVRHILNLETCISVIASYFYGLFIEQINKSQKNDSTKNDSTKNDLTKNDLTKDENRDSVDDLPLAKINTMRYSDWVITTPFMLLALSMLLGYENKIPVRFKPFLLVLFFNLLMLGFGYSGEIGLLNRSLASFMGFIFLFLTFGTIWKLFMTSLKATYQSKLIFWLYLGLWSLYGVFYHANEAIKLIGYNMLDLTAKAFVGIFFWLYLTKSVIF